MTIDQQYLNNYFNTVWRGRQRSLDQYQYSGWELIGKVRPGERVIDIGCGDHPFKQRIANLVGIDPAFPEADYQLTLEEFVRLHNAQKFNVAFCLGSINFGTQEEIEHQISLVKRTLRERNSRIYWRCNPGQKDHGNTECNEIDFYPWTFDEHIRLAELFGFTVVALEWDTNNRIYAEWFSNNSDTLLNTGN
jgi:hypothetical protein